MAVLLSRDALHVNDFLLYNIDAFENWNNPISISSDRNEDITWRRIVILTISLKERGGLLMLVGASFGDNVAPRVPGPAYPHHPSPRDLAFTMSPLQPTCFNTSVGSRAITANLRKKDASK